MIQLWFNRCLTTLARLIIYSCIISLVGIFSYSDGYLLASPDTGWTRTIATSKSTHDICVITVHAIFAIVFVVKLEEKVMLAKEVEHIIVEWWVHRPFLGRLRFVCRLRFFGRHGENGWTFGAKDGESYCLNMNGRSCRMNSARTGRGRNLRQHSRCQELGMNGKLNLDVFVVAFIPCWERGNLLMILHSYCPDNIQVMIGACWFLYSQAGARRISSVFQLQGVAVVAMLEYPMVH